MPVIMNGLVFDVRARQWQSLRVNRAERKGCNIGSDPMREFVNDGRGFIGGSEAAFPI